jgi:hypothetical protein
MPKDYEFHNTAVASTPDTQHALFASKNPVTTHMYEKLKLIYIYIYIYIYGGPYYMINIAQLLRKPKEAAQEKYTH